MPRREAVRLIVAATAGLGAACTPVRHLAGPHAQAALEDPRLTERVLRSFVWTLIPGAPADSPDLVRVFYDPDDLYRDLVQSRPLLVGDLCRRAERWYQARSFDQLEMPQRTSIVQSGLQSDLVTQRLYSGAIWAAQIAFYAGIWDDDGGCSLIGFKVAYRIRPITEIGYADPDRFLAHSITSDGNHS